MYPFNSDRKFVENRWYIAAFSDEVGREPIGRTILDVPLVLYRTEAGAPVAMYGICPHRFFPLAKGRVEGDAVVCGYHGFRFEADGKCSAIPSQGTAAGFCQPTYPLVERGPLCWIWMGDRDLIDPDLIPPYEDFGLGQQGWHFSSANHFVVKARAQLLIDNLMDLTHLPYLHWHIPGGDAMKAMPMREEERERSYRLIRTGKLPWSSFNDWSLRTLAGPEMKTGFGWVQAKPPCSMAPFAITPDELGDAWRNGRVCLNLNVDWNGKRFGAANGEPMGHGFHELVAHAARTRDLVAGTVIGSGTVSNAEFREVGSSCIAERRSIEVIDEGAARTAFMAFGDRVRMEAVDAQGCAPFGAIDQEVVHG